MHYDCINPTGSTIKIIIPHLITGTKKKNTKIKL